MTNRAPEEADRQREPCPVCRADTDHPCTEDCALRAVADAWPADMDWRASWTSSIGFRLCVTPTGRGVVVEQVGRLHAWHLYVQPAALEVGRETEATSNRGTLDEADAALCRCGLVQG